MSQGPTRTFTIVYRIILGLVTSTWFVKGFSDIATYILDTLLLITALPPTKYIFYTGAQYLFKIQFSG